MSDLPGAVEITEEGPREAFQIEPGPIPTARKIALIDALSDTGLKRIQAASFVSPKIVPGWADAEDVVAGITPRPGVSYTALWFNPAGLQRALAFRDRLDVFGSITVTGSEAFAKRNLNRDHAGQLEAMRKNVAGHHAAGVPVTRVSLQAAFGCNFSGDVPAAQAVRALDDAMALAKELGLTIEKISLADSMGWATPARVERLVGEVLSRYPEPRLSLHLHDTRGMAVACAHAGLRMGVSAFDAAVGGLGGCPFAAHPGAAGNIATEELVFLCEELGIDTGVDLEALLEAAALAQDIVGHVLPSAMIRGGGLNPYRIEAKAA
ncbi:hydroxymethylglutaryl-CoA lyase [Roseomonas sp. SSH11]|uniref:Hydroxymethylglutaryl-CoA lyase n=1 Tax=Pararoseomonas baculiformis TaxID=2820812 RepID=A0ABS4ADI8_9PROT|nr:hydroxymethylglutaryl-CoA lyase [Pararoseomonas baculiformis]MBP0445080.1 hydroxymethylglutaryl-CoA lyase [Pararoseomonas baculiformis]